MKKKWQLEIVTGFFMILAMLGLFGSVLAMIVAVLNLFGANWGPMFISLGVAAGALLTMFVGGLLGTNYDDRLRLIDGRGPVSSAKTKPGVDPLYATIDEIIGFHTVDRVLADLPDSIRESFTPAGQPCPSRHRNLDEHDWYRTRISIDGDPEGSRIGWTCRRCWVETQNRELAERQMASHIYAASMEKRQAIEAGRTTITEIYQFGQEKPVREIHEQLWAHREKQTRELLRTLGRDI